MNQEKVLVVGCGLKPKPYAINLDRENLPGVNLVIDLDNLRLNATSYLLSLEPSLVEQAAALSHHNLPFSSGQFDRIECEDVLEHVERPIDVVQELGRILKVGGRLWIRGPDCRYLEIVWADLTHRRAFSERTFDGFDPSTFDGKNYGHYHGPIKFRIIERAKSVNKGLEWTMEKI